MWKTWKTCLYLVFSDYNYISIRAFNLGSGVRFMIGKPIGKIVGKIITLPITIVEETEKVVEETIKEIEKKT